MTELPEDHGEDAGAVIDRYCTAWVTGDLATVVDLYDDELVLTWTGSHHLAGEHRGKPAALDALLRLQLATGRSPVAVHDILASGGRAIAWVTERWERDGSGLDVDRLLRFEVRAGRIVACRVHETDQHAVDQWLAGVPGSTPPG
ncbi:MAG: hypothetical protein AVDCRST_MAG20-1121 [uncultured Acidimicrobiales bacterium]|uniref:SnoaL-like domain-containing protein n=1 Tax=uncultured Acidimicrobiales bacterium TaxID=310071 RepID=A0A6J4HR77_9ACTN|nr:MAG: hypothetical protein AVDCRST_MAG20-1121 [uncultured Acidimicrobiales bacterium]